MERLADAMDKLDYTVGEDGGIHDFGEMVQGEVREHTFNRSHVLSEIRD